MDENGCFSWKKFWKGVGLTLAAVVVVAAVTVATVFTAGGAALLLGASAATITTIMTATAVGGLIAGGMAIVGQGVTNGFDNLNLCGIAIDTFSGAAFSGITAGVGIAGTTGAKILGGVGKVFLSGLVAMFNGLNRGRTSSELTKDIATSMLFSAILQPIFMAGSLFQKNNSLTGNGFTKFIKNLFGSINNNLVLKVSIIETFKGFWKMFRGKYEY